MKQALLKALPLLLFRQMARIFPDWHLASPAEERFLKAIRAVPKDGLHILAKMALVAVREGRTNPFTKGWGDEVYFALIGVVDERVPKCQQKSISTMRN